MLSGGKLETGLMVGEPKIDGEHQALLAQLDRLLKSEHGRDADAFSEVLSELGGELCAHFAHEDAIFRSLPMPESEVNAHLQAHNDILEQYAQLNLDLMGGLRHSQDQILEMVKRWVIEHIIQYDLKIRDYLPK